MTTSTSISPGALRDAVRAGAENRPGIYRMLSANGVILYVGKSRRVRTRLLGYFRAKPKDKAWRIVREAQAIDWEYVPSEFAALLRELELIKRFRPPFNVRQKRDGIHSYLKVTAGTAPRLHVVRRVTETPGVYFGPFRGGRRIRESLRELNDVMMLRDCRTSTPIRFADQRELFPIDRAPLCPRHELGRCLAPCAGLCTELEYDGHVERAVGFLMGETRDPVDELERRMIDAAGRLEFEHAAALRNRVSRLEALRVEFQNLRQAIEGLTFLYAVPGEDRRHSIYAIRGGAVRAVYPAPRSSRERHRMLRRAERHFSGIEKPGSTAGGRIDQILLVAHWFRTRPDEHSRAYTPDRWDRLPLAGKLT